MKRFYAVLVDGMGFKADRYESPIEAGLAASEACISNGRETYVMECKYGYRPVTEDIEIEEYS